MSHILAASAGKAGAPVSTSICVAAPPPALVLLASRLAHACATRHSSSLSSAARCAAFTLVSAITSSLLRYSNCRELRAFDPSGVAILFVLSTFYLPTYFITCILLLDKNSL